MNARSVISREGAAAAGPFEPGHLTELTRAVPFEMVDEVLDETGRTRQRDTRPRPSRACGRIPGAGRGPVPRPSESGIPRPRGVRAGGDPPAAPSTTGTT